MATARQTWKKEGYALTADHLQSILEQTRLHLRRSNIGDTLKLETGIARDVSTPGAVLKGEPITITSAEIVPESSILRHCEN